MSTIVRRKTRRDLAAEATRDDLLIAGAALAREAITSGAADPLRLLSPQKIAERASQDSKVGPVTRGMLYHLWRTENKGDRLEAYRVELYCKLFAEDFNPERFTALIQENLGGSIEDAASSLAGLICQVANIQFRAYRASGVRAEQYRGATLLTIIGEGLMRSGKLTQADLQQIRVRRPYDAVTDIYRRVLDDFGLEVMPPLCVEDVQEMLWSLQDGFTMNSWHFRRLDQSHDLRGWGANWRTGENWTLMAIAAYSLVRSVTRPSTPREAP